MQREYLHRQHWIIERPRIRAILQAGLHYPLISVVAGHGYGKTTAVANFCKDTDRRLIWMHLLPVDNDPARFWRRFCDEIKHELPDVEQILAGMEFPTTLELFDDFLRVIAQDGYRKNPVLLVFDNMESLENPAVHKVISSLIQIELDYLCVILISNARLATQKSFTHGKQYYIGADQLRFDAQEIVQLFAHYGQQLSADNAERLQTLTDGWPLPLQLIASQPQGHTPQYFEGLSYQHVITELFEQNCYMNYDEDTRRTLVKLALLPCVSRDLIWAVGAADPEQVYTILSKNVFISYNYSKELFYFQAMYQAFLVQKEKILSAAQLTDLYSAAGMYYARCRFYPEALKCYWHIRDYDRFLAILSTPTPKWINTKFTNWVLDKLLQFPADYRADHAFVDYYIAILYLNAARVTRAEEILRTLITHLEQQPERTEAEQKCLAYAYAVMVDLSVIQNNTDGVIYAQKVLEASPQGVLLRTDALPVAGNNDVFFLPDPATPIEDMVDYATQLAIYTEKMHNNSGKGYFDLFIAEAYFLSGKYLQAVEYSTGAIYLAKHANQHDIVANAYFLQMHVAMYQGDGEKAELHLRHLREYVAIHAPHELIGIKDCAKAYFHMHMNNPALVPIWLTGGEALPSDIPLAIGRDRLICAIYQYVTADYHKAFTTLLELDGLYKEKKQWSIEINATVLKAGCLLRMRDDVPRAIELLHHAYELSWPNRILTCFVEMGHCMLELLDAAAAQDRFAFDPEWMKTVLSETQAYLLRKTLMLRQYGANLLNMRKVQSSQHSLTPREAEVLSHWANGFSRDEIASMLGITVHGVKKHIGNIYMKLNAVNRLDAIHIAKASGLLEE